MKPIKIIFHFKSSTGKNLNVCSRALCCYPKCRMQMTCRSAIAVYVCGALRLSNAIIDSVELGASQIFNCCNVECRCVVAAVPAVHQPTKYLNIEQMEYGAWCCLSALLAMQKGIKYPYPCTTNR